MTYAGSYGPWTPLALTVTALVLAFIVLTMVPKLLLPAVFGCYSVMVGNTDLFAVPGLVDLRFVALGLAIYLAMLRGRTPRFGVLNEGIFPAVGAFVLIGVMVIPMAADPGLSMNKLLGTTMTAAVAWILLCATETDEIRWALRWVSGIVVFLSIFFVFFDPSVAIAGGRWRGVTANANMLGIFAGIFFLTGKSARSRWSLIPVAWVLFGSASRASTFALGLVAGPKFLENRSKWMRRGIAVVAIIVAIPIINAVFFSAGDATGGVVGDSSVSRTDNSRAEYWEEGMDLIRANPFTGVGPGSEPELLSSSVLSPLVEVGLLALIPLGLIVRTVFRRFPSEHSASRSIFLFLVVNGIFEMWLFAGGSIIYFVFAICAADPERVKRHLEWPSADDEELPQDDAFLDVEYPGARVGYPIVGPGVRSAPR